MVLFRRFKNNLIFVFFAADVERQLTWPRYVTAHLLVVLKCIICHKSLYVYYTYNLFIIIV